MNTDEAKIIRLAEQSINTGVNHGMRGLYREAIETFDRALLICQPFEGKSRAVKKVAAQALSNKGAALGDFERDWDAVECYDAAIRIYQQLAGQSDDASLITDQAIALMNKGWALIKLKQDPKGFRCLLQALEMRRQLVAAGMKWVRSDVARSLYNLGWGYLKTMRFIEALTVLDEAVEILQTLIAEGENGHAEDLAYVLGARADSFTGLGRYQESLENCHEVCALFTSLALSQNNARFEKALIRALDERADVLRKLKMTQL